MSGLRKFRNRRVTGLIGYASTGSPPALSKRLEKNAARASGTLVRPLGDRPSEGDSRRGVDYRPGRAGILHSADTLDAFLASWPEIDHTTGLSLRGNELLIKARARL